MVVTNGDYNHGREEKKNYNLKQTKIVATPAKPVCR